MRSEFDKELHTMHKELMGMGASCERAIALAASSITNGRPELTDEVRAAEEDIDRAERRLEAHAALDLGMAAKYFERIGDHAVNVAEWVTYAHTGEKK